MSKKSNMKFKSIISVLLTLVMLIGMLPTMSVFAAQSNEYVDPADNWLSSNNRTNEFDVNATITNETQYCCVCEKTTAVLTYRVPEYTKTGETALNRGVKFSDGTCIDGETKGNLDGGTPGVDAFYTTYHWSKSICQNCGTINAGEGYSDYAFNNNVYILYSCDHNFFLDFDSSSYVPYNDDYHLTTLKRGQFCKFCKGTLARAAQGLEYHEFSESIDAQVGNNRFYISETCDVCEYETSEYVTAKTVVTSYFGKEDGDAHTLTVTDLSDDGVKTSIRYGTSAGKCTKTSAPNYTKEGYYTVYYEIDYSYEGETMTENGVSYVWLMAADEEKTGNNYANTNDIHEHDYHYLETIKAGCDTLGYERWQCDDCGDIIYTNYITANGHDYEAITIKEANCVQNGLTLWLCGDCGAFYQETTAKGGHDYEAHKHEATCKSMGYTDNVCTLCGDNYLTNLTPIIDHDYESITRNATCEQQGYTTHICSMCNISYVDDYVDALGHDWDKGTSVTSSTCTAEGVIEYSCNTCGEKMIKATSANGHTAGAEATCTAPQLCEDCGTVLENAKGHNYNTEITEPTCTAMGYTTYTCGDCGDTYNSDYTDKAEHNYNANVTEPTCTSHGYTTYSCEDCDAEYIADYVDKKAHEYAAVVTSPTCTAMGYTTYTCEDCDDSYVSDYTNMTEHNYNKETVEPTCEEHGYTVYTCPDCGKTYIGDYTENKEHTYSETVIKPTCTTMGYTIYKCNDCEDEYKGEYKEPLGHSPSAWIVDVAATIEKSGSKHIECTVCGETMQTAELPQLIGKDITDEDGYAEVGDYSIILSDENGKPIFNSEITIDINDNVSIKLADGRLLNYEKPTTITAFYTETQQPKTELAIAISDSNGNMATGETNTDGQLIVPNSKSNTGTDNGTIGKDDEESKETFVITITDKYNVVIPDCDIYIGESNNVVVDLPEGIKPTRENPVIVTITDHEGNAQADVTVIALGDSDFIEKGITDIYGKLTLPTASDGYTDEDGKVNVDELNVIVNDEIGFIPNAYVQHNEDGIITVTLPEEKSISYANRITVTVLDSIGKAVVGTSVTVKDFGEITYTDVTDENGQIVVPPLSEDITDENGYGIVNGYNITVSDEYEVIENAFIQMIDGQMYITLPENAIFDYHNRITAAITDSENNPVENMTVVFTDGNKNTETVVSDENGKAVVPPVNKDMTDIEGKAVVDGYNVLVTDETQPIANAYVEMVDGKISIVLPENSVIDINNRITATVTDAEGVGVKDLSVTFTDNTERTETNLTDENGKATVPPTNIDETDKNGYGELNGFAVTVKNETANIEKAFISIDENNAITVKLPEGILIDYADRVSVIVQNKADGSPAKGINVTVTETIAQPEIEETPTEKENTEATDTTENSEQTETTTPETVTPKSLSGVTDNNGLVVFPPLSEDITDNEGGSSVTDKDEQNGTDTDGDGNIDVPGETVETKYVVSVKDTKGNIADALVTVTDGKINIKLPASHVLSTSNQVTATVKNEKGEAVKGVSVTIADSTTSKTGTTNANGEVTLPVKTSSGGSSGGGSSSRGGGGGGSYSSTTIKVVDSNGKSVSVSKSTTTTKATLTLPTGKLLTDDSYTITVTSGSKAKADYTIVLKDKKGNEATGTTDDKGVVILPGKEHKAYIFGYSDGTFRPDNDMSRAEAAAIFARLIAEEKGETVNGKATFSDVASNSWCYKYIGYLENYDVIKGYSDGTFRPDAPVTRAEFVTMAVRYYDLFNDVTKSSYTVNYTDLNKSYWAYADIAFAKHIGWLNGYADGTFKGDNNITRAEVVTVTNHATGRTPDEDYINKNISTLNKFTDLKNNSHWGYYDCLESANTHIGIANGDAETWVK